MIVGLAGCKGSGKDTAADILVREFGYTKLGFADKLKEAVAALFNIEVSLIDYLKNDLTYVEINYPLSTEAVRALYFREFLQRFGTEMGREVFGEDFWVDQWRNTLYDLRDNVVVPDVRFRNEAVAIHRLGGIVIRITRPGHEPDGHASEEYLNPILITTTIHNDGDLDALRQSVLATYNGLMRGQDG